MKLSFFLFLLLSFTFSFTISAKEKTVFNGKYNTEEDFFICDDNVMELNKCAMKDNLKLFDEIARRIVEDRPIYISIDCKPDYEFVQILIQKETGIDLKLKSNQCNDSGNIFHAVVVE